MNSKTTLLLAATLAGLVMGYYGLRRQPPIESSVSSAISPKPEPGLTRDLLAEPLGNVIKVTARRGSDEWVFEKKPPADGGAAAWHMTKPSEAKALSMEVDRIARDAGKIQYEISYKPGEGGLTAQDAGLSPPASIITLTDDAGKTATIEIGRPVSENETYARKAGDETIVVAKSNLRKLLKTKPLEYRDLQIWNFVPEQATHIEVCETMPDQKYECQHLTRDGGQWKFDRPIAAKATAKVDEMLKAVARLRITQWQDDDASKLKLYGLDPGALQISVTVEETVPVAKAEADKPQPEGPPAEDTPPATEKRTRNYKLQVADRGPIGEDNKVFVRSFDENAVATIFKSAADKFKPVMSEWREMQVVTSDVTRANHIELNVGGKNTVLVQKEDQWTFETDGSPAESHAITELLAGIKGLKAVSFVEGEGAGPAPSFDSPQADIRLTIPGVEGVERITVGGYTDPAKRVLVFVRRGESGPIAKVKASEIAALIKPPASLRDHTVVNVLPEDVQRITIERPAEFLPGLRQNLELVRENDTWIMASPTPSPARVDEAAMVVNSLSSLRAESIVGEAGEATAFGLHEPTMIVRMDVQESASENAPAADTAGKSYQLMLAQHDGRFYAKRDDGSPIYELNKAVFDQLRAEFRSGEPVEFESKDVEHMTVKSGEESNSFVRKSAKWVLESEPDLPIDSAKIDKILTEARAIKPERFAAYASDQLAPCGLEKPHYELSLTLNNSSKPAEKSYILRVSEKTVNNPAPRRHPAPDTKPAPPQSTTAGFATLSGREGVFLLSSDAVKKIFVPLNELEKK